MKSRLTLQLIFFIAITISSSVRAASSGNDSSTVKFMIPVRFSISAGYQNSSMVFDADRKNDMIQSFAFGADFNVPIAPIHTLIGITGSMTLPSRSGDNAKSSLLLLGGYIGYTGDQNDIFVGPAAGLMSTTLSDTAAAPNSEIALGVTSACGMGGWRHYFGKGLTAGFGINGYYCAASSYDKTLTSTSLVQTKSTISSSASAAGGYVYLLIGWNETRQLF